MPADSARHSRRLFFSIWPSDEFCAQVEAATRVIARESGGRIVPPRNFHVTLLFLGEVFQSQFDAVQQAAAAITGVAPFELSFERIEAWPGSKVLCLTSPTPPEAAKLSKELQFPLQAAGFRLGQSEFRPHITLARDLPRISAAEPVEPLRWKVNEFVLVESRRDGAGSNYSLLDRWPLPGSMPSTS